MRTRRTKDQIRKDNYNKDVDAYNFYVVNLDTKKAETGFQFKEDAVDLLNDYDDKKKYKVVSKRALKSMGIENPNESFKYIKGGGVAQKDNVYFKPIILESEHSNFLTIIVKYPIGDGFLTALGQKTRSGQERDNGQMKASEISKSIVDKLNKEFNIEDIDVSDNKNGKVVIFAVSDDFVGLPKNTIEQKLKTNSFAKGGGVGLIGNQKRIDMNKNGKIDAEDFKLLRSSMNGAWRNERKHVNHNEDYEIRYARKKPSRTGYKGKRKFEGGGDLFENYKEQPAELSKIVNFYMNKFDDGDYDYEDSKNFLKEVEAIGYTFDYGLDNEPYNLRPLRKMFFGGGVKKTSTLKKYENFEGKIVITKDKQVFKVISQDKDMVEVINPNLLGTGVRPTSINISEINKIV